MFQKSSKKVEFEKFCDGVCYIVAPQEQTPKLKLNFSFYKIGIQRFFTALSSDIKVSECIRVPQQRNLINASDTVKILDENFCIYQVQHENNTNPPTSILTLTKV